MTLTADPAETSNPPAATLAGAGTPLSGRRDVVANGRRLGPARDPAAPGARRWQRWRPRASSPAGVRQQRRISRAAASTTAGESSKYRTSQAAFRVRGGERWPAGLIAGTRSTLSPIGTATAPIAESVVPAPIWARMFSTSHLGAHVPIFENLRAQMAEGRSSARGGTAHRTRGHTRPVIADGARQGCPRPPVSRGPEYPIPRCTRSVADRRPRPVDRGCRNKSSG